MTYSCRLYYCSSSLESVAFAAHGEDVLQCFGVVFDLAASPGDVRVHGARGDVDSRSIPQSTQRYFISRLNPEDASFNIP